MLYVGFQLGLHVVHGGVGGAGGAGAVHGFAGLLPSRSITHHHR